MKTNLTFNKVQENMPLLTIFLVAGFIFLSTASVASSSDPCKTSAQHTFKSCKSGTADDYWIAIAKCDNLPDSEQKTCTDQAKSDIKSAIEECSTQLDARVDICDGLGGEAYNPVINPNDFVVTIDNPYYTLTPGTTFIYEGETEEGTEHVEVTVTDMTKEILGVTCIVVIDTATVNGEVIEDTLDWYAQDKEGNVWYFGENSKQYEDGEIVSLSGSWEAGANGASPGIVMKANPQTGDMYRQEFDPGNAEDMAEVLSLSESITIPYGSYSNLLMTKDFSGLEPDTVEHKYFAKGIGFIESIDIETGETSQLIEIKTE